MRRIYWTVETGPYFEVDTAMAKEEEFEPIGEEQHGFVPVLVARSRREANDYCQLFSDHDIPAIVGDEDLAEHEQPLKPAGPDLMGGVPVLVEQDMLEEAREIIADREDIEGLQTDGDDELEDEDDDFHFVGALDEETGEDTDLIYEDDEPGPDEGAS